MHAKRHISTSATDLHMSDMSDSVKRLAIAREGHPVAAPSILPPVRAPSPILTVMSNAKDDFTSRYEVIREIGKGGFSTVYQCRQRTSGRDFAVKVSGGTSPSTSSFPLSLPWLTICVGSAAGD